ncbi:ferritin-like domain-containing protein [Undibacterium sp.]|uniref:ferritin-like domain-containing protein n=1 Tax=Undibacterium sp. TaxID=1914977 RepID=UPI00374DBF3E
MTTAVRSVADRPALRWNLKDIDFDSINPETIRHDKLMFYMLASASLVEIMAELYTDNLIEKFRDKPEVVSWLRQYWQHEEVQHGYALKAYVEHVWPEFDWQLANTRFREEYSALCTEEQLEDSPALELIARCVVETGTTTMYHAVHDYVREPVLRQLFTNIKTDESNHYAHFRKFYEGYGDGRPHGVWAVGKTIWRRMTEIQGEDSYIAFKHVFAVRNPHTPFREEDWQEFSGMVKEKARHHYPYAVAVKMLMKLIPMSLRLRQIVEWPLLGMARLASRK